MNHLWDLFAEGYAEVSMPFLSEYALEAFDKASLNECSAIGPKQPAYRALATMAGA